MFPLQLALIVVVALQTGAGAPAKPRKPPSPDKSATATIAAPDATDDLSKARAGDADAQFRIGALKETESPADLGEAIMWYYRAAAQKQPDAQKRLRELVTPVANLKPAPAPVTAPDTPAPVATASSPWSLPVVAAFALAGAAVFVSLTAIVISWTQTRRALRDAGLI